MLDQLSASNGLRQSLPAESNASRALAVLLGGAASSNDLMQNSSLSLGQVSSDASMARNVLIRNLLAQQQEEERQRLLLTLQLSSLGRLVGAPVGASSTTPGLQLLGNDYFLSRPEGINFASQVPLDAISNALLTADSSARALSLFQSSVSSSRLGNAAAKSFSFPGTAYTASAHNQGGGLTLSNLQSILQSRQDQVAASTIPPRVDMTNDSTMLPASLPSSSYPGPPPQTESDLNPSQPRRRRKGRTGTFPQKLHKMLIDLENQEGGTAIASFLLHGRSFAIHNPTEFAKETMPKYFRMSRFSSFQRQLNLYDFQRINDGPNKGGYYHELFVRDRPVLCTMMKRNKIKGVKLIHQQRVAKNQASKEKASDDASLSDESDKEEETATTTS